MNRNTQSGEEDIPEQIQVRKAKRLRLMERGHDPYPAELPITSTIQEVRAKYSDVAPGEELPDGVALAGRVMFMRPSGKIAFVVLQAGDGTRLQIIFSLTNVGKEELDNLKADVDLGDQIFVSGHIGASQRGELSVFAHSWHMASKSLRPLPKTFTDADGHESSLNEETRIRRRHLDLITRQSARDMVRIRAALMRSLRRTFESQDYIEVETPILQTLHGGAAARPFTTHINAYDEDLYLRIATELYLKRSVVGGVDKVYEIGKNFRNEGADSSHSPEFTALEAYQAYGTYDTMAQLAQDLVQNAARDIFGTTSVTLADGSVYELGGEWAQLDLYGSLSEKLGEEITVDTPRERLEKIAQQHDIGVKDYAVNGKIVEDIWEELVGNHLYAPTFVRDFPEDTSPLTRYHRSKPGLTEKWDLYIRGVETGTAYSELADPVVQRERLTQQSLDAANGDPEAMQLDEEFIEAMEYGFPPSGGIGMGIDRILMAMTGLGIRETITFPFVKPAQK